MNAQKHAEPTQAPGSAPFAAGFENYLDVRYAAKQRPYTQYPAALTHYLTETYLSHHRSGRLLDMGCGRGEFLHGFASAGFDAIGVDRALTSDKRFPEPVIQADYERAGLPFESESFSVLFNKSVLEHVSDVSALLGECWRVLEPGGRLLCLVPDWRAQWAHFYDDWTHVRPFTLTGLRECVACHGFEVVSAQRFRQLPLLWRHPALHVVANLAALLPEPFKVSKFVRFSKEWMLLVIADKPRGTGLPAREGLRTKG